MILMAQIFHLVLSQKEENLVLQQKRVQISRV